MSARRGSSGRRARLALLLAAIVACGGGRESSPDGIDSAAPAAETADARDIEYGAPALDPAVARAGDSVGTLVLDSIAPRRAYDSTWVGTSRFRGEIELAGRTMLHPDFPDVRSICFEADSSSARRLPRWTGDARRAWFCLSNEEAAARSLAAAGEVREATIVIDEFTIHRGMSDEVNEARLVRVVRRSEPTSVDRRRPPP